MTNQQFQDKVISDFRERFINLMTIVIPVKPRGEEDGNHKLVEKTQEVEAFILESLNTYKRLIREDIEGKYNRSLEMLDWKVPYDTALTDILNSNLLK